MKTLFALLSLCVWLTVGLVGCDDAAGGDAVRTERDAAESAVCRLNSDCPPGLYCKDRRCDFDCREPRDCAQGERCASGRCVPDGPLPEPAPGCSSDTECDPPARICEASTCVGGCRTNSCGGGQICDGQTGRCVPVAGCSETGCAEDELCNAVTQRCEPRPFDCRVDGCAEGQVCGNGGGCIDAPMDCRNFVCPDELVCNRASGECEVRAPNCNEDGCPDGQVCDAFTGDCEAEPVGQQPIGEACEAAADCETAVCLDMVINRVPQQFCSSPCCSAADCPASYGCLYVQGAKFCMPTDAYPPGFNFDREAGQDCGPTGNSCRSGLCENRRDGDRCIGGCCTDADCGQYACRWEPTFLGTKLRPFCALPLGDGRQGAPCTGSNLFECWSNVCVARQNPQQGQAPGLCAELCCSDNDCAGGYGCGQVIYAEPEGYTNIVSACVELPRGDVATGQACVADEGCQSGHCVEGTCSEVCCDDRDCLAPQRCLPRRSGELGPRGELLFIRICTEPPQ